MKKILTLLLIFIFTYIPISTSAITREFNIPSVDVNATINDDGSIDVLERITYKFDGDFNGVFRNFEASYNDTLIIKSVKIIDKNSNITEAEEGYNSSENTYEINQDGNTQIKLYTKSSNENKTIEIQYRLLNVISKNDVESRLYWNFYSVENVSQVDKARLNIKFNGRAFDENNSKYHIYGDGNINTNYNDGSIDIKIDNLTSILAVDLTFPSEYLVNAPITEDKEDIIYPEENWNSEIINQNSSSTLNFIPFALIAALVGMIIYFVSADSKEKREAIEAYRNSEVFICEDFYNSPPEDISPAIINLIKNDGRASEEMLSLTLFYLAYKGYYSIENIENNKRKKDLKFTRDLTKELPKEEHLKYLIDMFRFYETNGSFTMLEIEKKLRRSRDASIFRESAKTWSEILEKEGETLNITTKIKNKTILTNYYYNEQKKWNKYKEYLENLIRSEVSEEILQDSTLLLIQARALGINSSKLEKFNKQLLDISKNAKLPLMNHQYMYCNNYFMYYILYNQLYNKVENRYMPDTSSNSFGGGGFTGSTGGGGFSGGGGGGSGGF